jgi:uncharacterized membrane protein (DUF485 family)
MTSISHEPQEKQRPSLQLSLPEMWASVAIVVMWLSVLFDAIFGPDIVNTTVAGDHAIVPPAVVVALFAFLGTWVVARYGFKHEQSD